MIVYKTGSIFDSTADALVNPVNCVGTAGKGLAKEFRNRFPNSYLYYRAICMKQAIHPGQMLSYFERGTCVINFPTKKHWRERSSLEYIVAGLPTLVHVLATYTLTSVAVPKLGCGCGKLAWDDVKPLIVQAFEAVPNLTVEIYE
jgi:O-acetyl-ADP-ribose deacetylase (regulator of RNase III)